MPSSEVSQFSLNNIPFGVASSLKRPTPQCVTRIDDSVIFLAELAKIEDFSGIAPSLSNIFSSASLNSFAGLPRDIHAKTRAAIQALYKTNKYVHYSEDISAVTLHLPVQICDFTDFSSSRDHMLNASEAILGSRTLPPAFHKYPSAYAGRASSIVLSGSSIQRPLGQFIEDFSAPEKNIIFGACRALDYELEVGAIIGRPIKPGQGLKAHDAADHIFGLVLVNDWSARDIQGLEMNPLGPFNSKNFATSISPWIITAEALKSHTVPAPPRLNAIASFMDDPNATNYDLDLTVEILRDGTKSKTCKVNFDTMYWTFAHMIAHHTIGGCGLQTGDMVASGTVSGEGDLEHGCLLEFTKNGKAPYKLADGNDLIYLKDGDTVKFTGLVGKAEHGIGFGQCTGTIVEALRL